MSYHRRQRRYQDNSEPSLIEDLFDLSTIAFVRMLRGLFRFLAFLWRCARGQRPASNPQPASIAPAAEPTVSRPPPLPPQPLPYRRVPHLLSKGERAFWYPLYRAVRGKYRIFCKVRLADLIRAPQWRSDEPRWFSKIRGFHVDFVLCDPKTTAPLLAIELDDHSHNSPTRDNRDQFKAAALASANLPLYRILAQQAYDPIELAQTIDRLITPAPQSRPLTAFL